MNTFTQAYRTTCIPKASRLNTVIPREYVGRKLEITIIPFEDEPEYNAETLEALQEAKDIIAGKIKVKSYKTVEEMDADIEAEEDDGD
ncbi:MAG: hypothetical protein FWH22_07210, partial [Fibromonadales bacterium]|nr:hypothetical protein [Fibromonadales bacterium]